MNIKSSNDSSNDQHNGESRDLKWEEFRKPPSIPRKYRGSLQYWSGSPEKSQSYQPAFNVGPSSARQRNAVSMAFSWRADDGPIKAVFGSSIPQLTKKNVIRVGPPLTKLSGSAHAFPLILVRFALGLKHII